MREVQGWGLREPWLWGARRGGVSLDSSVHLLSLAARPTCFKWPPARGHGRLACTRCPEPHHSPHALPGPALPAGPQSGGAAGHAGRAFLKAHRRRHAAGLHRLLHPKGTITQGQAPQLAWGIRFLGARAAGACLWNTKKFAWARQGQAPHLQWQQGLRQAWTCSGGSCVHLGCDR